MSEKSEKATPFKLQKAKKQGQVSKSTELNTSVCLLILVVASYALWPDFLLQIKILLKNVFRLNAHIPMSVDAMSQLQHFLLSKLIVLWLPFAFAGVLSIIIATILQTGFVWSTHTLSPDFKRLNLHSGFKRLFSLKLLFEGLKNSLKLSLVLTLLILSLKHELNTILGFIKIPLADFPKLFINLLTKLLLQIVLLLLALSLVDKLYTRWKFAKDHRMSKQELKEEYRAREGCPKIKSRIKQLQQQLRQKTASLAQVKNADVIITNPRHLAIALQYERLQMPAPKVVCKAEGYLAKEVRRLARDYQIPIIENKTFARSLFTTTALNQFIKQEHFPIAAIIFREIFQKKAVL